MNRTATFIALLLLAVSANATTYDLASDTATNLSNPSPSNPNPPWAFLSGSTPVPYQSTEPAAGINSPGFSPGNTAGNFLPLFWDCSGSSFICAHSYDPFNGGLATGEAFVTWTAPVSGTIDISGFLFYDHPSVQRSNDFSLTLGNTLLTSGSVAYNQFQDQAHEFTYSTSGLPVTAGEMLSFELVRSAGQAAGSVDAFDWTITETPVPESSTAALVGFGIIGLAWWRRARA